MEVSWFIAGLVAASVLGWFNARAGYHNGFIDGARWMRDGDGYPSKPGPGWYAWDELKHMRKRTPTNQSGEENGSGAEGGG